MNQTDQGELPGMNCNHPPPHTHTHANIPRTLRLQRTRAPTTPISNTKWSLLEPKGSENLSTQWGSKSNSLCKSSFHLLFPHLTSWFNSDIGALWCFCLCLYTAHLGCKMLVYFSTLSLQKSILHSTAHSHLTYSPLTLVFSSFSHSYSLLFSHNPPLTYQSLISVDPNIIPMLPSQIIYSLQFSFCSKLN